MRELVYLASPYSSPSQALRNERYAQVTKAARRLVHEGVCVFSPILHSHPLVVKTEHGGYDFWQPLDVAVLSHCSRLYILRLSGWEESIGIAREAALADALGIPTRYLSAGYAI